MKRRCGFTLLEVMLATALSVMLLVGMMAVVADFSRDQALAGMRSDKEPAVNKEVIDAWVDLLRGDLSHAEAIDASDANVLSVQGYGALDACGRARTHRPVQITYRREKMDGEFWIVRRQEALDVLTNRNIQRDLVCRDVTKFELAPIGDLPAVWKSGVVPPAGDPNEQEPAEGSDGKAVPVAPDDPEKCILVNGLMFYPRYAPAWAREKARAEEATARGRTVADAQGDSEKTEDETSGQPSANGGGTNLGITWRLRVWVAGQEDAAYERIVKIQLTGGA